MTTFKEKVRSQLRKIAKQDVLMYLISSLVVTRPEPDWFVHVVGLDGRVHALLAPGVSDLDKTQEKADVLQKSRDHMQRQHPKSCLKPLAASASLHIVSEYTSWHSPQLKLAALKPCTILCPQIVNRLQKCCLLGTTKIQGVNNNVAPCSKKRCKK
jgi:hypothetical protein